MSDSQVIRIPIWPLQMINAYLLLGPSGAILVDSGLPGSEKKIEKVLAAHGLKYADIKLIVITHAHTDHAGSAARIRSLSGAPIVAHEGDLKYYLRQEQMTYCPTSKFARLFLKTGAPLEGYEAFQPDILLKNNETLDLQRHGFSGTVRHSPGHTPGSISVDVDGQQALVGDMLSAGILIGGVLFNASPMRPPFEEDPAAVAEELQRFLNQGTRKFYLGHGGPVDARAVEKHVRALRTQISP